MTLEEARTKLQTLLDNRVPPEEVLDATKSVAPLLGVPAIAELMSRVSHKYRASLLVLIRQSNEATARERSNWTPEQWARHQRECDEFFNG